MFQADLRDTRVLYKLLRDLSSEKQLCNHKHEKNNRRTCLEHMGKVKETA